MRLSFSQYSGYVYGLESLSQLVETEGIRLGVIRDEPQVVHRGILIDSVRHFISVPTISRLIESMPLSKLNVLHWHISDDEAFSLRV